MRNNAVHCHEQLRNCVLLPLTLGNFFTPVWHLAGFLYYLNLETLRSVIFLSVKANVSTMKRILSSSGWNFFPPKLIIFWMRTQGSTWPGQGHFSHGYLVRDGSGLGRLVHWLEAHSRRRESRRSSRYIGNFQASKSNAYLCTNHSTVSRVCLCC